MICNTLAFFSTETFLKCPDSFKKLKRAIIYIDYCKHSGSLNQCNIPFTKGRRGLYMLNSVKLIFPSSTIL